MNLNYQIKKVHINQIIPGDTIVFNGELKTVGKKDIKRDSFMGTSIFGDSYRLGYQPVEKAIIHHSKPEPKAVH